MLAVRTKTQTEQINLIRLSNGLVTFFARISCRGLNLKPDQEVATLDNIQDMYLITLGIRMLKWTKRTFLER